MTERLYYTDCYLRQFTAQISGLSADGFTVYLDRTAFYPTSGGQPFDTGTLAGIPVVGVADEDAGIAHQLAAPLPTGLAGHAIECAIDWERRFDHMQQHTGQHLLSAVFEERFGMKTVSFHLGAESCTIDLEGKLDAASAMEAEGRANRIVCENRPVSIDFEDAAGAQGLRKASDREGTLRIVSIQDFDRSACGGTHLQSTGEIGAILLRKLEKVRQTVRVEFLCGGRAVRRARADYEAVSKTAQIFSSPIDEVPSLVALQVEAARAQEKARRKLELELAAYQGRELYQTTAPDASGFRRVTRRADRGNLEDLRAIAQNFTAQSRAVFLAALADPPSVLLAASEDAGVDAGKLLKAALTEAGGRGGGTVRMAQGSVPDAGSLERVIERLIS
jgi:alanyl-tRNA synthetase